MNASWKSYWPPCFKDGSETDKQVEKMTGLSLAFIIIKTEKESFLFLVTKRNILYWIMFRKSELAKEDNRGKN